MRALLTALVASASLLWTMPLAHPAQPTGPQLYELLVKGYAADRDGYSYVATGMLQNQSDALRRVLVEAEDLPLSGAKSLARRAIGLPAGKAIPFSIQVRMAAPGERNLSLRVLDPESRDALSSVNLLSREFPPLAQAYLDRSYYTREKAARATFALGFSPGQGRLTAELEVRPKGVKEIRARAAFGNAVRIVISQPLAGIPLGEHPAALRIRDGRGGVIVEETTVLRREPPAPSSVPEVKADHERMAALVNEKPFFPIGIYAVPPEYLGEVAKAGFNTVIGWDGAGAELSQARQTSVAAGRRAVTGYFDACRNAGLWGIEWPTRYAFGYGKMTLGDLNYRGPRFRENFRRFMGDPLPFVLDSLREHPSLLAYYGPDEPGEFPVRDICAEYSRIVTRSDPYRPNFYLFCSYVAEWPEAYDIAGQDVYTVTWRPAIEVLRTVRKATAITGRHRVPYWHVPLVEWCSGSSRAVTGAEQRIQTYLAIIGGAKGMLWWMWPATARESWEAMKTLAGELKALAPVLTEAAPAQTLFHDSAETRDSVQALVQEHAGKTYLVAANAGRQAAEATFTLPEKAAGPARVWFEDRAIPVKEGRLSDHFDGYGTHVYEIAARWPSGGVLGVSVSLRPEEQLTGKTLRQSDVAHGKNLILNSGFENESVAGWPDYWRLTTNRAIWEAGFVGKEEGAWGTDAETLFEGRRSLRVRRRERPADDPRRRIAYERLCTYRPLAVPVTGGEEYTFSVYLNADWPGLPVRLFILDKTFAFPTLSSDVTTTTDWQRYSLSGRLDPGQTAVVVRFDLMAPGTLWADAAQLERSGQATPYEAAK
ncbi:MAG: hypothetical protein HY321_10410 [Armatimonadetes bacterium]|nr:hypothetical protein [Armatimonadota bacterium]